MTRLFHVSDVHFGREDKSAVAWFDALVAAERPDAVVMTGDLTMRARRREFDAGIDWLRSLGRSRSRSAITICPISIRWRACSRRIAGFATSRS